MMRAFLYDLLTLDAELQSDLGGSLETARIRVVPRASQEEINIPKPFLVYGLGTNTNELLAEDTDHVAHRQYFQVWVHDEGGDYDRIDRICERVKKVLTNASHPPSNVTQIRWLELSGEFANQTYNTLFRYQRFQAIISKGAAA